MKARWAVLLALVAAQLGGATAHADAPSPNEAARRRKIAAADSVVSALDLGASRAQIELRRARARREGPRTACLDDLLTRMHVAARAGRSMRETLAAALAEGDELAADRELARITWLGERALRLTAETARCGAPDVASPGGETVVHAIVPALPDPDR